MRAAIYARVSSDKQDTDLSISAQVRALREYAARNGCQVVRDFVDEAESGRTAARPAFREMIALARTKNPPFDAILVWKLNRFSRSRADSITYKAIPSPTRHCSATRESTWFPSTSRWMTVPPAVCWKA